MRAIHDDQLEFIKGLYYERGLSMQRVGDELGVSIDAVITFMRRHDLVRRTLAEDNAIRFARKPLSFCLKTDLTEEERVLKTAGVMLYWGEGFQADSANGIDFANSNPKMIAVFIRFLHVICGIDESRLRGYLYCYSNQNPRDLVIFWSNLTGIPTLRISKPYVRHDFNPAKIEKMVHGTFHVRYFDRKLLEVVRAWIQEYADKFAT